MSFGGFKFGASSTTQPSAPQLSVTNPTPGTTPSTAAAPFSFGNPSTSQPATATGATSGGGLFGSLGGQQQPGQAGTSLFGAKPATGGGLFGSTTTQPQQPAAGGGLFGSTATPQQPAAGGGGLFGSTSTQPQPATSGGLFGSTNQAKPATGGGLFGSTTQQPSTTGGGLFGSTTGGGGLFGSTNAQSSTQQPQQNSLFGSTNQQQQPQQSSSIFGQAGQPQSSSLFGQTAPSNTQNQQLQTSTSNQNNGGGISKTTKFSELPEGVQKYIEQMDTVIKTQKAQGSGMNIEGLGRAIWQTSLDVKAAHEEHSAISHTLKSISTSLTQLRERMINEGRDVERVKEIWDVYRSAEGRMGQVRLGAYREFPQEFFAKIADQMEERVGRYKKTISQLNRAIVSLSSEVHTPSPQAIAQTIQNHQQAMLTLAAQLDGLQLRMNGLRSAFAEEWREKTGSVRDPFEIAREEKAVKA
ncbi:hypothetical protein I302_103336 [Kwoniella bestiolae CBS 10118]|uniref:Nucleoporin p58/p45 n=1 Tax=Kwoniella bestiolae CBS 10118 TaxID=1296100 RepID=A0A1B9G889_9TREE|nr:nucleoporin p58/p45 [Kwoniella bestiolae CBS 10118]OCF27200.1 nucleoporin p58/p45 [Kwoniella bestiolae CBS 10118]